MAFMQLTKSQIKIITQKLSGTAKFSKIAIEELTDHYCSLIESHMDDGLDFQSTSDLVFNANATKSLQSLNKSLRIIDLKNSKHMKVTLLILGLLFSIFLALRNYNNSEPPSNFVVESTTLTTEEDDPPSLWPIKHHTKVSSNFGMRIHPVHKTRKMHLGIDIPARRGEPILASANGTVIEARFEKNYGNYIVIRHDDMYSSKYSQLSKIHVKVGDTVEVGKVIGQVVE